MRDVKKEYLCNALDRFKEMVENDECSKIDIAYFCNFSKRELELREVKADKKQWLTKEEASRELGVSTSTFDRNVLNGRLPRGKKRTGQKTLLWKRKQIEQLKEMILLRGKG